jgi:hypothetical protein
MQFRVRLKGFNFMAHVPAGDPFVAGDVLEQEPVPAEWLPFAKKTTAVPCTWLLVEARDAKAAQAEFLAAHGLEQAKLGAPLIVEELAPASPAPVT